MTRSQRPAAHLFLSVLILGLPLGAVAQDNGLVAEYEPPAVRAEAFDLSIRNIMLGAEHVGQSPGAIRFTDDSRWIYFRWVPGGDDWDADRELYRVRSDGGDPERVPEEAEDSLAPLLASGEISDDGRWKLVSMDGDILLVDRESQEVRHLTETREREASPTFMAGGERVAYRVGSNLFSIGIDGGGVEQITDIRSGSPPGEEDEPEGLEAFLRDQQIELFEFIRRQQDEEDEDEEEGDEPEPFYVPGNENLGTLRPNPRASHVLLSTSRSAEGAQRTPVPFWVTESGYTESRNVRTKVGDEQGTGRAALLTAATGQVTWLDATPDGYDGEVRTSIGSWNDPGTRALVYGSSDNDEDAWMYVVDADSGEMTLLEHFHDDAWLGGPCSFCRGWIPGTDRVWYVSEETGYSHVYTVNADGTGKQALTSGDWEVLGVDLLEGQERFFVRTNERSPFDEHAGWLDFDGGPVEYLTGGEGRFSVTVSPDGERLAVLHDVANRPPELYVAEESDPDDMERVTLTPTEEWLSFPWVKPEIVRFPAEDGTMVPARIYRPDDMNAESNGAAVIFVHGAGYLHNVHNYWSSYYREYMFNHFLASAGYTVLDIDYRGSAGYGRDWRTAIYRWMGGKDLSDQVDGARWLVAEEGVDPDRIGIYGGSYGGFITLMALFTADDTFKSGAALRSVTDWAHYNDGYTSNILNDPQEDPEAYQRSSPIYFAENFGPDQHLVMLHGMVDTNVHFSDVVRLAQRLVELGKENWEMAVYPVESHGFSVPSSWTDEYRRIFELFERTISRPGCTEDGARCSVPMG